MKHFFRSLFLLPLFILGMMSNSHASHWAGGDISYVCVGQDSFIVTLNLFRDCSGAGAPTSQNVNFTSTCGDNVNAQLTLLAGSGNEVSQLCDSALVHSTCNPPPPPLPALPLPGLQQYTYTGLVVLSAPCNFWSMEWSSCCRNDDIVNIVGSSSESQFIYTQMYSGIDTCNNSPYFTAPPIPYVCLNQVVNYNFGVVEPDGDSIAYFMTQPYSAAGVPLVYPAPYTFQQPLPGANAVLNQTNGQLTFVPTATGMYVVAVRIEEYDINTGVLKHVSIRDIQVVVQTCSNTQASIDSPGIYNFTGNGTQLDSNSVEVCEGDSFAFEISLTDPDPLDSLTIEHNIYQALDSTAVVTITNGNPATLHVAWTAGPFSPTFTAFAIYGEDDACPIPGIVSGVFNVHIIPSTYAGEDQDICRGTQWANLEASGGDVFMWTVISGSPIDTIPTSPNFNMTCFNCADPVVSPDTTTTYVVINMTPVGCYNTDTVTVFVHENFNLSTSNDTMICTPDSVPISVTSNVPGLTYSYNWAPSSNLSNDSIPNPIAYSDEDVTYGVTVTAGGCIKTAATSVNLAPSFPPGITIDGDSVVCYGDSTVLMVNMGGSLPTSCGITGPCSGVESEITIGTGTMIPGGTQYPNPYGRFYWGAKHQFLYTAAELNAMGMVGGKITSLAFDVATVGSPNNMDNFQIRMGCTGASDLSTGFESGLVTVLPSATYNTVSGWNTHAFADAYDWDGISNLVIEVCYNNGDWSTAASSLVRYDVTPFTSTRYYVADNSSICGSTVNGTGSSNRPNIKLGYCFGANDSAYNYSWSPIALVDSVNNMATKVFPTQPTTFQVVVSDTFGACSDTITHDLGIVTQFDATFSLIDTVCVNGGDATAIAVRPGGVYSGVGIVDSLNGIFDPAVAGVGTFTITYFISSPNGSCSNSSTQVIEVIAAEDPSFSIKEFCETGAAENLIAVTPGGVWSGQGISDPVLGTFDPSINGAGDYDVTYTILEPCVIDSTRTIRVVSPYAFSIVDSVRNVCLGDTLDLSNNYILSTDPNQGDGPIAITWYDSAGMIDSSGIFTASGQEGDVVVTLTIAGEDGTCGTSQEFKVRIQPIDYANAIGEMAYCSNNDLAVITVQPWLFGIGVTYTQTPMAPLGATDTLDITAYGQNGKFDARIQGKGKWAFEMTYENIYGCIGVTMDTIYVLDTPVSPTIDDAIYCQGDSIFLSATGVDSDSIYWYSRVNLKDTIGIGSPLFYNIAPDPNDGDITVYVTENNWACVSPKVPYTLPIKPSPVSDFNMSYTDSSGQQLINEPYQNSPIFGLTPFQVDFNALGVGANDSITWFHQWEVVPPSPATINSSGATSVSWIYNLPNMDDAGAPIPGTEAYINTLVITNEFGCSDTNSAAIYSISSEDFYNVFTPNGDGLNDVFYVPVFGLIDYKVQIFNRWGKLVYEWFDPSEGWTGEDQPDGVYFYVVTGTQNDAASTEYKKQGTVTLTGANK